MLLELIELVEEHDIKPVVGEILAWGEASSALARMMKQGVVGKLVVSI